MFSTLLLLAVILGVLVLAHEWGHFWTARKLGVTAEEFGFGFPPRIVGFYKGADGKRKWIWGNREIEEEVRQRKETVYSINWIPLGGFVKIKGEDGGEEKASDSFSSQKIWKRFVILSAGVLMNFVLAGGLFFLAFYNGVPEIVEENYSGEDAKVQIVQVARKSPAEEGGVKMGDEVVAFQTAEGDLIAIKTVEEFQELVKKSAGQSVSLVLKNIQGERKIEVAIRSTAPEGEGLLGVVLAKTAIKEYGFWAALGMAIKSVFSLIGAILFFLKDLVVGIFSSSSKVSSDVAGPVGIAVMTGQVAQLGWTYLFQFAAMLSVNLGVINFLPLPALDGGRALFLLIEKIKGRPISRKIEGYIHTAGFAFLLGIMVLVTVKDFSRFEIITKLKNLF